jgi:hypothetical protein
MHANPRQAQHIRNHGGVGRALVWDNGSPAWASAVPDASTTSTCGPRPGRAGGDGEMAPPLVHQRAHHRPAAAQRLALGQARLQRLDQLPPAGRGQGAQPGQVERHPHGHALLGDSGRASLVVEDVADAHVHGGTHRFDGGPPLDPACYATAIKYTVMISIWLSHVASAARGGAGGFDVTASLKSAGEVAKPLAGVIIGFALARIADWWRARPNAVIASVRTRSLYAHPVAVMHKNAWIQCAPDHDWNPHVLVVINAMVHNRGSDDDAVMEAGLIAGDGVQYKAPGKDSMVEAFVPVPLKAHGIASLRMVFELPRLRLGDDLWSRVETSSFTLKLTTLRGQSCIREIDLTDSFMEQHPLPPESGWPEPPPIRGYTEVRVATGVTGEQTSLGNRRVFQDHELW